MHLRAEAPPRTAPDPLAGLGRGREERRTGNEREEEEGEGMPGRDVLPLPTFYNLTTG